MKENMKVRGQLKWYLAWPLLLSLFLMFANVAVLLVSWQAACMMLPFTITYIAMSAWLRVYSRKRVLGGLVEFSAEPAELETALYNIAMTFIVRFMNQMDVDGMNVTARSYAIQIANFSYCVGAALAQANAIMTGWRIGAKEFEECNRGTRKAAIYGIITATCFSVTFAFAGHFIVHIFTDDIQMINLVVKLLIVDIFLELGRVTNLVYGQALKTSGDAFFPVILGAIFMYLFAVGGTYFLGIHMGLLAVGAYIAMAGDECARAVGMVLRWKSGKWKSKGLVEV